MTGVGEVSATCCKLNFIEMTVKKQSGNLTDRFRNDPKRGKGKYVNSTAGGQWFQLRATAGARRVEPEQFSGERVRPIPGEANLAKKPNVGKIMSKVVRHSFIILCV